MDERKAQELIHQAASENLAWLDRLPSRKTEILEKVNEEADPVTAVCENGNVNITGPAVIPAKTQPGLRWFRPALALCAALVLIAGVWTIRRSGQVGQFAQLDVVTEPAGFATPAANPEQTGLPAGMIIPETEENSMPLDRIDLYADPDALWNDENGILAEGGEVIKKAGQLPFQNTVYRKAYDTGISTEGELVYRDGQGNELFRDRISLQLGGDSYSIDMPQKSFLVKALDGGFEHRVFDDRTAESYPSLLLRNSGNDCLFTRVADGLQHRLIEQYTDIHVMTLAWRPVQVYLNDEYWGMYNIREDEDGHTVCRYEQVSDDLAGDVIILGIGGSYAYQGSTTEFIKIRKTISQGHPAENPEDLAYLEQEIDVENWLDWLAAEMYFGNSDIGTGRIYRVPGGKWKCMLRDLDYGLYNSQFNSVESYLKEDGMGVKGIDNSIFRKILEVDQYKKLFLTKLGNLYRSLTTEVMQAELDRLAAWIEPGMQEHLERWAPYNDGTIVSEVPSDPKAAWDYWKRRIDRMKNTMSKRPALLYQYVQEFFGMDDAEMAVYFE